VRRRGKLSFVRSFSPSPQSLSSNYPKGEEIMEAFTAPVMFSEDFIEQFSELLLTEL